MNDSKEPHAASRDHDSQPIAPDFDHNEVAVWYVPLYPIVNPERSTEEKNYSQCQGSYDNYWV
jgi:hypothetical protein